MQERARGAATAPSGGARRPGRPSEPAAGPGVARAGRCQRHQRRCRHRTPTGSRAPTSARSIDDTRVGFVFSRYRYQSRLKSISEDPVMAELYAGWSKGFAPPERAQLPDAHGPRRHQLSRGSHQPPGRAAPGAVTGPCCLAGALCPSQGGRGAERDRGLQTVALRSRSCARSSRATCRPMASHSPSPQRVASWSISKPPATCPSC